jgi:hypothetical protein
LAANDHRPVSVPVNTGGHAIEITRIGDDFSRNRFVVLTQCRKGQKTDAGDDTEMCAC